MLRNPRVWLYAAGGWLIVTGVAHLVYHVWYVVLETGMVGQREFAMGAMKQAFSFGPLQPSMWRVYRMLNASFGLLLVLVGTVEAALAWTNAEARTMRMVALLGTVFWTVAFAVYAFVEPVTQPLVIAVVAVPMHGIAYLTASERVD